MPIRTRSFQNKKQNETTITYVYVNETKSTKLIYLLVILQQYQITLNP